MAALTQTLNNTEETLVATDKQDSAVKTKMDSMTSDAQKLERTIKELLDQVEFIKNSDIRGKKVKNQSLRCNNYLYLQHYKDHVWEHITFIIDGSPNRSLFLSFSLFCSF